MLRANNIIEFVSVKTSVKVKFCKRKLLIELERDLKLTYNSLGKKVWLNLAVGTDNCIGFKLSKHQLYQNDKKKTK